MEIPVSSKKYLQVIVGAFVIAAIAAGTFWLLRGGKFGPTDYVIPEVPYFGVYNHIGTPANHLGHDKDSAVASVLGYWIPGQKDFQEIAKAIDAKNATFSEIEAFVNGIGGMKAETKTLKLGELRNYIFPKAETPLITFFAVDESQPVEAQYYPARVLIGLKESEKKLIFHDYWQGNNFEISFDEYAKLLEKTSPGFRNKYIVIQPADLKNKLQEIKNRPVKAYPARTEIMEKAGPIFKNYAMAVNPYYTRQFNLAEKQFFAVTGDPGFEEFFPPEYKVRAYAELAEMQFGKNDLENALANVQKAIALNHDLDKPFKDWPGFEFGYNAPDHTGEFTVAYRVQGDIYLKKGDFAKAKDGYAKALEIKPTNSLAKAGLAAAEAELSKK